MTSLARLQAVLSLQDQASGPILATSGATNQLRASMTTASASADLMGTSMQRAGARTQASNASFRQAVPSLATFGSSMASLLVATGALESRMGTIATSTLAFTSAAASAVPAVRALIGATQAHNAVLRANVALRATQLSLSLPLIGGLIAAGAVGVGVGVFAATQFGGGAPAPVQQVVIDNRGAVFASDDLQNDWARRTLRGLR